MFHSNTSPFNQRQPKAGPSTILPRHHHDTSQKPPVDIPKRANSTAFRKNMDMARPIITNSRVKQDEKYKKDMYLAFVNNALFQKSKGNSEPFDELVNQFSSSKAPESGKTDTGIPATQLRLWISALSHIVSQLDRAHSALIQAIVDMPWTTMDASFVKAYVAFIGMLVSARPEYLSLVLEKTARGFTFRSGLHAIDACSPEGTSSPLTRRIVYDRLHHLLEHLLSLIPTLPATLQPLLVYNFPHKRQDRADQETYIRNILRITEYCPALTDRILSTVIDRAIQIDVEIQVEMEELETDEGAKDMVDVLLDPFDTVVGQEESDSEDEEEDNISDISSDAGGDPDDENVPEVEQDVAHIRDMVGKLDCMLKLLFDYFHRSHSGLCGITHSHDSLPDVTSTTSPVRPLPILRGSSDHGRSLRRTQFITLLSIFDRTIIRTFKSRYTQFLVFWYSSLDPTFTDMFQGMLISKALLEETQPVVTRVAAASYIASFVSRARFVDASNARRVIGLLCDFLEAHLDYCAAMGEEFDPNSAFHTLFYAVSQAAFLIFCFRWRDFQADDEIEMDDLGIEPNAQKKWLPKLSIMQRVITSELNPLKICSPNVVQQFARVARSTGFVYCYTILENNRRVDPHRLNTSSPLKNIIPSSTQSPHPLLTRDTADADLNTFFPFDPYKLPLSYSYIQGVYREWASVALDEEEEEEEEEEDEDEEDEEAEADLIAPSRSSWNIANPRGDDTDTLGTSFGGMSISPIRQSLLSRPSLAV